MPKHRADGVSAAALRSTLRKTNNPAPTAASTQVVARKSTERIKLSPVHKPRLNRARTHYFRTGGCIMKIDRYEEIPIESLTISRSKTRTLCPAREIADLAQSIKKLGLLTPIIVASARVAGKYKVVMGERRFLAVRTLGWATIFAAILDQRPNETQMRAILLTESRQNQLQPEDYKQLVDRRVK